MAAEPPSFYGRSPQIAQLPMPVDSSAPLREGLDKVGRALAGADERTSETDLQVKRIERERSLQLATGDIAATLAEEQGNLSVDLLKMRETAQPGAAGYEQQVEERIGKFRDTMLEKVGTDPELVARFADNIAAAAVNARVGETKWALSKRAEKSVTDSDQLQNSLQSNIRTAIAGGTFSEHMLADADALDSRAVQALPIGGNDQEKLIKARHLERLVTVVDARTDVDPHSVLTDLDAGKFGELDDKVIAVLRNKARVAADRLDNAAKQAAGEQAGVLRANARNAIEDVNAGTHVDPTELQGWLAVSSKSTKPEDISLAHDLKIAIAKNGTTAKFDNSTNSDRVQAIGEIETHKGWQDDPQLVAAHEQLTTLINRDTAAAEKDPVSLYQRQTGQAVPPLDLANPDVMRQRFIVADRTAQRFEKPVPVVFTEPEAKQLRDQYNSATVGGKADFILGLGQYGSARARQMMFQIAPTKPELVRLAELSASSDPAVQSVVREAADGSAQPLKGGIEGAVKSEAMRTFGPALSRMPGDRQSATLQLATWIYAHRSAQAGKADSFQPDLARQSIEAALGGSGGGKGGVGKRNGAPVVLPMGATQDDFDRVMAMGAAHPDIIRQSANGVPKWGDRDMTQRDFLDLVPVLINDTGTQTLYAFRSRGGSGYVKNEHGQDYVLDLRRLSALLNRSSAFDRQLAEHGYTRR